MLTILADAGSTAEGELRKRFERNRGDTHVLPRPNHGAGFTREPIDVPRRNGAGEWTRTIDLLITNQPTFRRHPGPRRFAARSTTNFLLPAVRG